MDNQNYIDNIFSLEKNINYCLNPNEFNIDSMMDEYCSSVGMWKLDALLLGSGFDGQYLLFSPTSLFTTNPSLLYFLKEIGISTSVLVHPSGYQVVLWMQ